MGYAVCAFAQLKGRTIQRPRPPERKETLKDPLKDYELGDPREEHTTDSIIPDTWYADEKEAWETLADGVLAPDVTFAHDTTGESLSLSEGIQTRVDRAVDWEERYWDEKIFDITGGRPSPPRQPPGDPPGAPNQDLVEFEESPVEALRANDIIETVIDRADKDKILSKFATPLDVYIRANTWRYNFDRAPGLGTWSRKRICDYVDRRDHKGSGNRKGKARGLAEQQQIKLYYLCRG